MKKVVLLLLLSFAGSAAAQTIPRPPRKGTRYKVSIDSSPQQAAIYLDDKQYGIVGYTPYRGTLVKGDYKLIIELPGFKNIERPITIGKSKNDFFFPMEKKEMPGTIDVQAASDPNLTGAAIFIDGENKGTVPNAVEVPKGRHLLELKKAKFNDYAQWVEVAEGARVTIAPSLKSNAKGSLLIDADVQGAQVSVDGKKIDGDAPALVDDLDEGPHIVEVSKPPATPWKQTIMVKAGARQKITAELNASLVTAQGASVRVLVNVPEAEVLVDGVSKGKPPVDATGLKPGQHIIEAFADGYVRKEQSITVTAGQSSVIKLDLEESTGPKGPAGTIKVVSPAPGSTVYIDGAEVGPAPLEKLVTAGEHFVAVVNPGFAKYETKVSIEAKKTFTVNAELKAVGSARFLSTPEAADVFIDGERVGKTPLMKEGIAVGDHLVSFRLEGYRNQEQSVHIDGGKLQIMNATLRANDALTAEEVRDLRRGLSSYGARTIPAGRFTVDASLGYPYWVEARATIGISGLKALGLDVTVGIRSLLTTYEFLAGAKVRFIHYEPFSLAAFGMLGGGGGASGRNEISVYGGAVGSITFNNLVTVSGRAYLSFWSDRLCKSKSSTGALPTDGPDVCTGKAETADLLKAQDLHGGMDLSSRDTGARFFLSAVVEAGLAENFNIFAVFEGAPFQDGRAAFSSLFNGSLLGKDDPIYSGRVGLTFKF